MNRDDLNRIVDGELALTRSGRGGNAKLSYTIPLEEIGEGAFATAYRERGGTGRVFAVVDTGIDDKDIIVAAKRNVPHNPHLPDIRYLGQAKLPLAPPGKKKVYVMPEYRRLPFELPVLEPPHAATELQRCWDDVSAQMAVVDAHVWRGGELAAPGDLFNQNVIACARSRDVHPSLIEALEALAAEGSKRDPEDYLFEFPEDNLMLDDHDNLVLLDVIFNRKNA